MLDHPGLGLAVRALHAEEDGGVGRIDIGLQLPGNGLTGHVILIRIAVLDHRPGKIAVDIFGAGTGAAGQVVPADGNLDFPGRLGLRAVRIHHHNLDGVGKGVLIRIVLEVLRQPGAVAVHCIGVLAGHGVDGK